MNDRSEQLYSRALQVIPGGVNSPVRAFKAVGGQPLFIERAQGCHIYDVDKNEYIDYVCSWGPMILGHNSDVVRDAVSAAISRGLSYGAPTEAEVLLASLICELVPGLEMVRMVNSGTEAVMSALRLARAYTGRSRIVKFAGCYHGHVDQMLVKAGSGAMTCGQPDSPGVTEATAADTLIAAYNNLDEVESLLAENQVAAVIVEPVAANMGVVLPKTEFLPGLRELCDRYGALLIFDEVITGFRLALGGAQEYYGVAADLVTYGKIIGAGLPVGAYGGRREIMQMVSPAGPVYQAGTLSGNPVAMAAGLACLQTLADLNIYDHLNSLGIRLASGLEAVVQKNSYEACVTQVGSLVCLFFGIQTASDYQSVARADTALYARYFQAMLKAGIYLAPSQFEAMFVGAAHTESVIEQTLELSERVLTEIKAEGLS